MLLLQEELRRRIRAAMALAGLSSWEALAERTPGISRSTLKDLGTTRGRVEEKHLRVIAAACEVPYSFFTVPSILDAVDQDETETSLEERIGVLERRLDELAADETERLSRVFDDLARELLAAAQELPPALAEAIRRAASGDRPPPGGGGGGA